MHFKCWQGIGSQRVGLAVVFVAAVVARCWACGGLFIRGYATTGEEIIELILLRTWFQRILWQSAAKGTAGALPWQLGKCCDDTNNYDDYPDDEHAGADDGFLTKGAIERIKDTCYRP